MIWRRKVRSAYTRDRVREPFCTIGRHTYGEPEILAFDQNTRLCIGSYCSISDQVVVILGGNHRTDWVTTYPFMAFADRWPTAAGITGHPAGKGDVVIGSDVWIGYGATILSGVTIGDGAVVGARAVVSRDVAPYGVVAGNPAREVGKRFPDEVIEALLELKWWDWPEERVARLLPLLLDDDVERFLAVARQETP